MRSNTVTNSKMYRKTQVASMAVTAVVFLIIATIFGVQAFKTAANKDIDITSSFWATPFTYYISIDGDITNNSGETINKLEFSINIEDDEYDSSTATINFTITDLKLKDGETYSVHKEIDRDSLSFYDYNSVTKVMIAYNSGDLKEYTNGSGIMNYIIFGVAILISLIFMGIFIFKLIQFKNMSKDEDNFPNANQGPSTYKEYFTSFKDELKGSIQEGREFNSDAVFEEMADNSDRVDGTPAQAATRKCPYCGREIDANASFCPNCGGNLNE